MKNFLRLGCKERYDFMCYVDAYDKNNVSMPDDASSGYGRPMTSTSSKEALLSIFQKNQLNW